MTISSYGVPQGSVLGRVSFSLYISPLEVVIRTRGVNAMMIADHSQLYVIMRQRNGGTGLQGLSLCI